MTIGKDKGSSKRKGLFAGVSVVAAAAAAAVSATPAMAQDAAGAGEEEIVVTGSRIARPGFTSNSPIATIGAEELQLQQPTNIEEVLRDMPQFSPGIGSNVNNGNSGASTVDLRGLTEPRTLVLVDGHRMPGFDVNGLVDTTAIPLALLERVDVVTGGASAVYGSDAIAGVVNFILNDDFQGIQLDADYSVTDHGRGETDAYTVTMGSSFDSGRGNVALSIGYLNRESVAQDFGPAGVTPGNSPTTIPTAFSGGTSQICDPAFGCTEGAVGDIVTQQNINDPTDPDLLYYAGFDFSPYNLYQAPQERWTATALGRYEINESLEAYSRFVFSNSTVNTQIAPAGTFGFTFNVPLNNPYLNDQASAFLAANNTVDDCATIDADPVAPGIQNRFGVTGPAGEDCVAIGLNRRTPEVGARITNNNFMTFQTLVGLRGSIVGWDWDVTAAHGETHQKTQQQNDVDAAAVQAALFCLDESTGCIGLNLFDPTQPLSGPQAANVRFNLQQQGVTQQDYFSAVATRDLGSFGSPWADTPIGVSIGAEYRQEESDFDADAASESGNSPGFGPTLSIGGQYDVYEYFTEAIVPLIENAPFAESINLELGFRSSNYSTSGEVHSYKYGADWAPIEGLRFRGMFQRAVRAANISELFSPVTPGTGDLGVDPCAGSPPNPSALRDLCLATGAPQPQLDAGIPQPAAGQINNFTGGNPELDPEKADTVTFGVVWEPTFVSGLSVTVDYYNIEIADAIAIRPAADVIAGCYSIERNPTLSATDPDCALVHRNALTGKLDGDLIYGVEQLNDNIGAIEAEGIDIGIAYNWDIGAWGNIAINFDGTHAIASDYQTGPDAAVVECVGVYGKECGLPSTVSGSVGGPTPENRWTQRTTWTFGDFDLSYRWRHLDAVELDSGVVPGDESTSIDAFNYIDLSAGWQITEQFRLNAGVTNVTDEEAPFVETDTGSTTFNSGNTYPSTYDVLGRVISVGATARF